MNNQTSQKLKLVKPESTLVVLIHGLAAHRVLMWPLSRRLHQLGFQTSRFGYRSLFGTIERHAEKFARYLEKYESDPSIKRIHIVAHSMGSIVTRQMLLDQTPSKLGRIVMLGAPNHGSPVARYLGYALPFCRTLNQISSQPNSYVNNLPQPAGYEIGVVAAKHDRVIPEPNIHLDHESDFVSIFSGHNGLLVRPTAAKRVQEFLVSGRFSPETGFAS